MIEWLNIIAGLILCVGLLEAIPAIGKHLAKLAKWLDGFYTIIGIILIIVVIYEGYWDSLLEIVAIFAGLIMIVGILPTIPAVKKYLYKFEKSLENRT